MTLLTVAEFRTFVETDLEDEPLQVLLDAAEIAIDAVLGDLDYLGDRVDIRNGGSTIIFLSRVTGSITSITETVGDTVTELDPDDWLLRSDGVSIERLSNGTNSPSWWGGVPGGWSGRVTVSYTPADDLADRKRVQVGLMRLEINQAQGATSFTIGGYSESGGSASGLTYLQSREALLASLLPSTWSFA